LGENSKVIATGGLAKILKSEVNLFDVIDVDLTLKGLQIIFDMNHTGLNK
jgi:type III pantothenate kinase